MRCTPQPPQFGLLTDVTSIPAEETLGKKLDALPFVSEETRGAAHVAIASLLISSSLRLPPVRARARVARLPG